MYTGKDSQDLVCQEYSKPEARRWKSEDGKDYELWHTEVISGSKYRNQNSVNLKVYDYNGLYKIVSCCYALEKSGVKGFKYKLV